MYLLKAMLICAYVSTAVVTTGGTLEQHIEREARPTKTIQFYLDFQAIDMYK